MKKTVWFMVSLLWVLTACHKEEPGMLPPQQVNASDGTAVGCIHLAFEKDPKAKGVIVERREKGTEEWQEVANTGLTAFDDNTGYLYTGMPPGTPFEYRLRNCCATDAPYSATEEGYAYAVLPVTDLTLSSLVQNDQSILVMIAWDEGNPVSFSNKSVIIFDVYRRISPAETFDKVGSVGEDRWYSETLPAELQGVQVSYRIDVRYRYYVNQYDENLFFGWTEPVEGTVHTIVAGG